MPYQLVATAAFGLEAVVVRELKALGYQPNVTRPGRIEFTGDALAVARTNLWLRSADRVLLQLARFPVVDFDTLFETTRGLPWEEWIAGDAAIPVRGRSRKSQLSSVPACQRTVKKAIVERLNEKGSEKGCTTFSLPETGQPVPVELALLDDEATLSIDTSGDGLHRRGYRTLTGPAQIRETLASALVQLSFWEAGRPLIDPFCGSGTIIIEAALMGRNLAPGRNRKFAAEYWPPLGAALWKQAREEASDLAGPPLSPRLLGTDSDREVLSLARYHAEQAGVVSDVHFQQQAFGQLSSTRSYGCLVTNPPYGIRVGEEAELEALYRAMPGVLRRLKTWSHFILTAKSDLEQRFGQEANRRRKLFNGQIECTYFQFHGPKPDDDTDTKPAFGGLLDGSTRQFEEFAHRLRKRARHLRRWPTKRGITCYRLYDRDVPDVPLVVDRYEEALHLAEYERPHERTVAEHADWLDRLVRIAGEVLEVVPANIFLKRRSRQRGTSQYQRVSDTRALRVVHESGLKFQVNLSDYLDTGLFLDHRITRQLVREAASGTNFLNLFGYTGAFSVYAAAGGATRTTTVDLSANYLDWARENLRLNGFVVGDAHRTCSQDVWTFFKHLSGRTRFDLVVIDPPTFSNSKRLEQDWDVQRDHARLLQQTLAHTTPGGVIFFSTNSRRFKLNDAALAAAKVREISRQTVPEDFRNQRIHRCWRIEKEGEKEGVNS
jgi:23S rRNA (guanine2445-N2)-methyltransferase / 23S rRNA (guanine2069-N7)-methyltransferase